MEEQKGEEAGGQAAPGKPLGRTCQWQRDAQTPVGMDRQTDQLTYELCQALYPGSSTTTRFQGQEEVSDPHQEGGTHSQPPELKLTIRDASVSEGQVAGKGGPTHCVGDMNEF